MCEDFKVELNENAGDFTAVSCAAGGLSIADGRISIDDDEIRSAIDYAFSACGAVTTSEYVVENIPGTDLNLVYLGTVDCNAKWVSGSTIDAVKHQLATMGHRLGYLPKMTADEVSCASIESLIEEIERAR